MDKNDIIKKISTLRNLITNHKKIEVETYEKFTTKEEIENFLKQKHLNHKVNDDLTVDIYTDFNFTHHYLNKHINFLPFKASEISTKEWLDSYKIKNYTINDNLTVDVNGSVDLNCGKQLIFIPIQFGHVTGDFNCAKTALTNTQGFPTKVDGNVDISSTEISSLHGMTEEIGGDFTCCNNSKLLSLKYGPKKVNCNYNTSFTPINNLKNFACEINRNFISIYVPKSTFANLAKRGAIIKELKNYYTKYTSPVLDEKNEAIMVKLTGETLGKFLSIKNHNKLKI